MHNNETCDLLCRLTLMLMGQHGDYAFSYTEQTHLLSSTEIINFCGLVSLLMAGGASIEMNPQLLQQGHNLL